MSDDATTRILTAIQALGGAIEGLGGRLDHLEEAAIERLDRLEAGQKAAIERLDRLEAGQKAATERLDRLEASQNKLRADVMERIDRVQNAVTQLRDDHVVNFGASDAVKRANENTREELRSLSEVVFTLVRQLRAISTRVEQLEEKR